MGVKASGKSYKLSFYIQSYQYWCVLGEEKETSLKLMFKMSVLGWGIKGLSLSWYTEQGCCQWRSMVHKVCVCSLQGSVHTAVQTAVLLMAYVFLPQWGKEEDNPWSLEEGRGAGSAALEPFFFRRFVSHKEDMPLGREIKGLTVSHWLNFHSKLDKDFKTLRKRLQYCVFFSRHRLWSQIASSAHLVHLFLRGCLHQSFLDFF